eukprot:TRINITY_DN17326_c0_g1_i10.p1 TRINITY_DN17326_c0_g1~~TRINITY_DN17326_c0_g1_i10.p1  ORF type:complete len:1169 (-),score=218.81 TRINITY_DN17326_c0_g1_i10:642-4148(-)
MASPAGDAPKGQGRFKAGNVIEYQCRERGEWRVGVVLAANADGSYNVDGESNVPAFLVRPIKDDSGRYLFQVGDIVKYFEESLHGWIPAYVVGVDAAGYDLDWRAHVAQKLIRPLEGQEAAFSRLKRGQIVALQDVKTRRLRRAEVLSANADGTYHLDIRRDVLAEQLRPLWDSDAKKRQSQVSTVTVDSELFESRDDRLIVTVDVHNLNYDALVASPNVKDKVKDAIIESFIIGTGASTLSKSDFVSRVLQTEQQEVVTMQLQLTPPASTAASAAISVAHWAAVVETHSLKLQNLMAAQANRVTSISQGLKSRLTSGMLKVEALRTSPSLVSDLPAAVVAQAPLPAEDEAEETKGPVVTSEAPEKDAMIASLQAEVERLREQLQKSREADAEGRQLLGSAQSQLREIYWQNTVILEGEHNQVPEALYVTALRTTVCPLFCGEYVLIMGHKPNAYPLWKQLTGGHWLYSGTSGRWLLGDEHELGAAFLCDSGLLSTSDKHRGVMPHDIAPHGGSWQRFSPDGWWVDASVQITLQPQVPEIVLLTDSASDTSVAYHLVKGEEVNGFPAWRRVDEEDAWLFSSPGGKWLCGDAQDCKEGFTAEKAYIASAEHNGCMPHEIDNWCRLQEETGRLEPDAQVHVSRHVIDALGMDAAALRQATMLAVIRCNLRGLDYPVLATNAALAKAFKAAVARAVADRATVCGQQLAETDVLVATRTGGTACTVVRAMFPVSGAATSGLDGGDTATSASDSLLAALEASGTLSKAWCTATEHVLADLQQAGHLDAPALVAQPIVADGMFSACVRTEQTSHVKIIIKNAKALKYATEHGLKTCNAYCICEVRGRRRSRQQSRVVPFDVNPEWNFEIVIAALSVKDHLDLAVFDKDPRPVAAPDPDELLGRVSLAAVEFLPSGFDGELPLDDAGRAAQARLAISVSLLDSSSAGGDAPALRSGGWSPELGDSICRPCRPLCRGPCCVGKTGYLASPGGQADAGSPVGSAAHPRFGHVPGAAVIDAARYPRPWDETAGHGAAIADDEISWHSSSADEGQPSSSSQKAATAKPPSQQRKARRPPNRAAEKPEEEAAQIATSGQPAVSATTQYCQMQSRSPVVDALLSRPRSPRRAPRRPPPQVPGVSHADLIALAAADAQASMEGTAKAAAALPPWSRLVGGLQ